MSNIIQEQPADVVLMGLGVMSGTIAAELSQAGHKVVGITRGPYWDYQTDFPQTKYDEWGIGFQRKFDFPASLQTTTIRNNMTQFALPARRPTFPIQYHSLGLGVGGAAQHYGGNMGRQGPWAFSIASSTASRYGSGFLAEINPNDDTEDWPLTYEQYEPYFVAWEQAFGVCGDGNGNVNGQPMPMSQNYPMPGHPPTPLGTAFQVATESLGYAPFPHVTSLASKPYVNTYGVQVNPCIYDGWCGSSCNYVCETGAKANSAQRSIPAAVKTGNFAMVLNSEITRIDTDPTTGLVTDIRYYDPQGNIHVQPGTVFFNGLWGYNQTRAMLISGVGVPYNPVTATGTVGRGLTYGYGTYSSTPGPSGTMAIGANAYSAGNASGGGFDLYDFMDDNFDHTGLNFVGGAQFSVGDYQGGGPGNLAIGGSATAKSQGSQYKATLKNMYLHTKSQVSLGGVAPDLPNTTNYWDIDPNYVDAWGDPCARITHDWTPNGYNGATYFGSAPGNNPLIAILQKMGATDISDGGPVVPPFSAHTDWWGHHWRGGNRVGKSQSTSTFNMWQQCWTAPNLFAAGEVNNTTGDTVPSGTHIAGPQVQIASEGIQAYLASPGLLTESP